MAVTRTVHSKPIGWARSDVIDLIEDAHTTVGAHMGPVTGLVAGVKSFTYGGENTQRNTSAAWDYYYDVAPTGWTGNGTGATFQVGVYNGKVRSVNPNRPGSGYANGDILTLNDLDFGGNGSNGVQDIQVTVYIEGVAQGGTTYTCEYDSAGNLTGIDANGAVSTNKNTSAGNITIAEGDTLLLKVPTDHETYLLWYDMFTTSTLGNTGYESEFRWGMSVKNVVNQGARQYTSSSYTEDSKYIKWKPCPGQAGTYYLRGEYAYNNYNTITVVAAGQSSIVPSSFGQTNAFFDKQNRQAAVSPWGVCRREVQENKKYGITYQGYQFNDNVDGQVEINIITGSGYAPQTTTLPTSYTIDGNARQSKGDDFDWADAGTTDVTQYDLATYTYDARFKGSPYLDKYGSPGSYRFNDSTSSGTSPWSPSSYATANYDDHLEPIADRNAYNAYSLDLISYQSGLDPKFVVYSFKQPNLSSTNLADNTFMTWFVHDYTSSLFDYNQLFLGGVTIIHIPNDANPTSPYVSFESFLAGQFDSGTGTSSNFSKRSAEFGFLPTKHDPSYYPMGQGPYSMATVYGSTSLTSQEGSTGRVNIYTRSNLDHTYRGVGGQYNNEYAKEIMPDSTNFNAVIKGLPLSIKMAPVPYYLPNDFAMIDFDVATPSANIQQGDTITVGNQEIYTIITGSYNQTDRTRGILFCARTT